MIYEVAPDDEPVRQGDIFVAVPKVELQLGCITRAVEDNTISTGAWDDIRSGDAPISLIVQARPITAIVISQDCDASRAQDISLCEVRSFHDVEGRDRNSPDKPKKWVGLITQHSRINQKWFYLPLDGRFRIHEKMAADFRVVVQLPLVDLEVLRASHRVGRLNNVAGEHFRERISEFFRRYPYDEWYPLDGPELEYYRGRSPEPIAAFPWQESSDAD